MVIKENKLFRYILLLIFSLYLFGESPLKMTIEPGTKVHKGEEVKIKITAKGNRVEFPKVKKIGKYKVVRESEGKTVNAVYLQGKIVIENKHIKVYTIIPEGNVTIPPFEVKIDGKVYKTKPSKIVIVSAGESVEPQYRLRQFANKDVVYNGEPLIITVEFEEPLNATPAAVEYLPPKFKNFLVKQLGSEKRFKRGDKIVHQLQYLLIPQNSGEFKITPARVKIGVQTISPIQDPFGLFNNDIRWYFFKSNPLNIKVKPLPQKVDLIGNFQVETKVDKKRAKANEPINFTLIIHGEGSLDDFKDPEFKIPGVTVYSNDAQVQSTIIDGKVKSSYRKEYVFLSNNSFTIPSLTLKEYDYTSKSFKTLKTPPIDITIINLKPTTTSKISKSNKSVASNSKTKKENPLIDEEYYKNKDQKRGVDFSYIILAFILGAVVGTLLAIFIPKIYPKLKKKGAKAIGVVSYEELFFKLYPYLNHNGKIEPIVRKLYEAVVNKNKKIKLSKDEIKRALEFIKEIEKKEKKKES